MADGDPTLESSRWSFGARCAFRFCFTYFALYCILTQIFGGLFAIPLVDLPDVGALGPIRQMVGWTAAHVFHVKGALTYVGSGSGDKVHDWVLAFCLLVFSVIVTGVWSVLDRKRENYQVLNKWFRLLLRFALASQMLVYGIAKVIPLQMPFPFLTKLIEPYGNFSPMGVLWSSIGASPAYEMFAGAAETLGGILLVVPRTTMFGALVCLADLIQVFMLNMTYDVPVKLFSFHLMAMTLILLAPEFHRLVSFFFLHRAAHLSNEPALFSSRRANAISLSIQIVFGIWLLAGNVYSGWNAWKMYGGGRVKSPLYGIWNVDRMSIGGQVRSPLLTDYGRWRRVIFDSPQRLAFQRMDDSLANYGASIYPAQKSIVLTKDTDKKWKATFTFQRVAAGQVTLDGEMDGQAVHMELTMMDRDRFLLVSRGFHWVQEYPFNR